jgi:hypothetical protein
MSTGFALLLSELDGGIFASSWTAEVQSEAAALF